MKSDFHSKNLTFLKPFCLWLSLRFWTLVLIYFCPSDPQSFALQHQFYFYLFFLSGMSCVFLLKVGFFSINSSEGGEEKEGELRTSKQHGIRETYFRY